MKTILITGASGFVGAKIYSDLKHTSNEVIGIYNKHKLFKEFVPCNLTNDGQVETLLLKIKPEVIIHTAAFPSSSWCEEHAEQAYDLHVNATKYLVNSAQKLTAKLLYISTFAAYNPSNVYGRTKVAAEELVKTLENYLILRPSFIIGLSPNLTNDSPFNVLMRQAKEKGELEIDSSWTFHASYLKHLSEIARAAAERGDLNRLTLPVIVKGVTSRYQIAKDLFAPLGIKVTKIDSKRIIPIPNLDFKIYQKLKLPHYTYQQAVKELLPELKTHFND